MNTIQLLQHGSIWGLVFSAVFFAAVLVLGKINVEMLLNEYPPDIRARFGTMSPETRKQANLAGLPLLIALLTVVIVALVQLRLSIGGLTLANTFIVTTVLFQVWNLLDLIVLDWFILMTLRPHYMILPGTEGLAGYRDYRFHFRKFLNGIVFTLILSGVVSVIALVVEMWI
jgi:small-conductance mechanosensitive channel